MLLNDYSENLYTSEDGVAALHVAGMLLDAHPNASFHMLGIGAVPLFLSRSVCYSRLYKFPPLPVRNGR